MATLACFLAIGWSFIVIVGSLAWATNSGGMMIAIKFSFIVSVIGVPILAIIETRRMDKGKPSILPNELPSRKRFRYFVRCWAIFIGILSTLMALVVGQGPISIVLVISLIFFCIGYSIIWFPFKRILPPSDETLLENE